MEEEEELRPTEISKAEMVFEWIRETFTNSNVDDDYWDIASELEVVAAAAAEVDVDGVAASNASSEDPPSSASSSSNSSLEGELEDSEKIHKHLNFIWFFLHFCFFWI